MYLIINFLKKLIIIRRISYFPGNGVSSAIYKKLIKQLNNYSVKTILDAEGELLNKGIEAEPFLLKPNLYELKSIVNQEISGKKKL